MPSILQRRGKIPKERIRRIQARERMLRRLFPHLPSIDPRGRNEIFQYIGENPNKPGTRVRLLRNPEKKEVVLKRVHKSHYLLGRDGFGWPQYGKRDTTIRTANELIKKVRKMVDLYNKEFESDMQVWKYRLVKPRAYAAGRKLTLQPRIAQPSVGHLVDKGANYETAPSVQYTSKERQEIEYIAGKIISRLEDISRHSLNSDDLIFLGFDERSRMVFMPTVDL